MPVDLGFIGEPSFLLQSRYFPSKIGGKPAWLDLQRIPEPEALTCSTCHKPFHFLCQIYCPLDESPETFHRTLFVFFCPGKDCFTPNQGKNFSVFRCQLPRQNEFYPSLPPLDEPNWRPDINCAAFGSKLCACGCKSKPDCDYCHEVHAGCVVMLKEFSLEREAEEYTGDGGSDSSSEEEVEDETVHLDEDIYDDPDSERFFDQFQGIPEDAALKKFKRHISKGPEQVLRYDRGGQPLWISGNGVLEAPGHVPNCEYCGGARTFEFQIMPQLLNKLQLHENDIHGPGIVDWGILVIYTCEKSCQPGQAYKKEFIWKQDVL